VKTHAVHCHSVVCSAVGGRPAGCRTSWVCLQHHAKAVTSNGVTVCGSKFPPKSVSTVNINTVQYQTQYKQCEIPVIPAVVIFKVLLPQFSIMAIFVRTNSCPFSDSSPGLPTYKNHNATHTLSDTLTPHSPNTSYNTHIKEYSRPQRAVNWISSPCTQTTSLGKRNF
jgi:hypothetical protein